MGLRFVRSQSDSSVQRPAHELRAQSVCSMRLFYESRLQWRPDSHKSSGENGERPGHLVTVLAEVPVGGHEDALISVAEFKYGPLVMAGEASAT
jgi:hypothetical protein